MRQPASVAIEDWADTEARRLCAVMGAYTGAPAAEFHAELGRPLADSLRRAYARGAAEAREKAATPA